VPGDIRFHSVLGRTRGLFQNLLQGSSTPVVVTADDGQMSGGPGSSLAGRTKRHRVLMTWPDSTETNDSTIRVVKLSGLSPGGLHWTLEGMIWLEACTLPMWIRDLPRRFFMNCRSLNDVSLDECRMLRMIGDSCFYGCVSLHGIRFPDCLLKVDDRAFASSGLEALDFSQTTALSSLNAEGAHWLARMRLPRRFRGVVHSDMACRLADASGGLCDLSEVPGRLLRFRWSAMKGPSGEPWRCLASAWATAELVAAGGRSGVPALPC
jgi:hypothetical protein